jgi:hypothetical protein
MTPPTAPAAPPNASASTPAVAATPVALRPLEGRFPSLYSTLGEEAVSEGQGKRVETRVAKENPPTVRNVVEAVCASHGVYDASLIADLCGSLDEFTDSDVAEEVAVAAKSSAPPAPPNAKK